MIRRLGSRTLLVLILAGAGLFVASAAFAFFVVGAGATPTGSAKAASLSAPTAATATVDGTSAITIHFTTPATQLSGGQYSVIRASGPGSPATVCGPETVAASTPTTCQDTGLASGTTYGYAVNAVLDSWTASASSTPSAKTWQIPAITSASSTSFKVGSAGTFSVTTTGTPTPSISNANFTGCILTTLPSGVTFTDNSNGTATLAGTPAAGTAGSYTLCLNATNLAGSATQNFTLTVNQAPAITSATSTTFTTGTAGTFSVTTTGFPAPGITNANFTGCTKSTLPSGVTFADNGNGTATLAGTPGAGTGGTYTLCLNASNTIGTAATQTFTLTVHQAPAITSATSTTFTTGTAGTFSVTTTGFPTNTITNANFVPCSKSTLPSGVTFADNGNNTATLAGTPGAGTGGTYTLCLNASNGVGSAATQVFTLTVHQAPAITSATSTTFTTGTAGTFSVTTTGFPTNTISNTNFNGCTKSTLPSGVTFTDNGDGTATIASTTASPTGSTTFCINAANGVSPNATQTFTLTISVPVTFVVTPSTSTPGAGSGFTVDIQAQSGGSNDSSYTGAKCLTFSGPASSPNSTAPSYPGVGSSPACSLGQSKVTFASGLASSVPLTLFDAQTVTLSVTDGARTGTTSLTVVPANLTFDVCPANTAKGAAATWTVDRDTHDLYGNVDPHAATGLSVTMGSTNASWSTSPITLGSDSISNTQQTDTLTPSSGNGKAVTVSAGASGYATATCSFTTT